MKYISIFAALSLLMAARAWAGQAADLSAEQLFQRCVSRDVRLSADGKHIELDAGELFEDDGPAAGYTYGPNREKLSDQVWARKELIVPNPQARSATLLLEGRVRPTIRINGQDVALEKVPGGETYWQAYRFDPKVLKAGSNFVTFWGDKAEVAIALDHDYAAGSRTRTHHPNRSARSSDGGKTWDDAHLGPDGKLDGEYYVRLFLDHYRPNGSMTSPVIDTANLSGKPIAPAVTQLKPIRVKVSSERESAGKVGVRSRTGSTFVPSEKTWSAWQDFGADSGTIEKPAGRYLQLSIDLSTSDPLQTPQLQGIHVEAEHALAGDWTGSAKVVEQRNDEIVRTSFPFEYEPFDQPKLAQLRTQYKLDEVVSGASSEFEMITRLAAWATTQFNKGHLSKFYPAWDALDILKICDDGLPVGGFCQHHNLVLLQGCESFGLVGRATSISAGSIPAKERSGHEVVEIWSNEYRKWVYVDGHMAWYATDDKGVPLSLLELHRRQIAVLAGKEAEPTKFVQIVPGPRTWTSLTDWPPFVELRMIPRSNFLAQLSPLPLNQGMQGWFWTGHEVWTDDQVSPALIYPNRIRREGNWQWTINQAQIVMEATEKPGVVRVQLDTVTPGFDTFVAEIDGAEKKPVGATFEWALHQGTNRLQVRSRNTTGREGAASWVVVDWAGK